MNETWRKKVTNAADNLRSNCRNGNDCPCPQFLPYSSMYIIICYFFLILIYVWFGEKEHHILVISSDNTVYFILKDTTLMSKGIIS